MDEFKSMDVALRAELPVHRVQRRASIQDLQERMLKEPQVDLLSSITSLTECTEGRCSYRRV